MDEAHRKRTDRLVYIGPRDLGVGELFVAPLRHRDRDHHYILPKDIFQLLAARIDAQHLFRLLALPFFLFFFFLNMQHSHCKQLGGGWVDIYI